ncbi:DUF4180 domain-containing protein [Mesorhizobium sp.]|uniref:DUF4180 domain-containing protein n=1 Tax=Mesorhizobium sp. TaxID=1871066 RepID=UPI0025DB33B2|nr:DUF4180 domain-containing protein [Mesorhizobium sp.]
MSILHDMHGHKVLEWQAAAAKVLDLIGDASASDPDWVAISTSALPADFFELKTGIAGEWTQKCVNYGIRLAILGDVSRYIARSKAFADFVREANRGGQLWFLDDLEALGARLAGQPRRGER